MDPLYGSGSVRDGLRQVSNLEFRAGRIRPIEDTASTSINSIVPTSELDRRRSRSHGVAIIQRLVCRATLDARAAHEGATLADLYDPERLNRPTLVSHGGFVSDDYAREELRAEIAAMMTGERLGVGHEPRHGTAYVSSWIKALEKLENDPKEIRAAAVDAQQISDWLLARERERSLGGEKAAHEQPASSDGRTLEPVLPAPPQPTGTLPPQASEEASLREDSPPPQALHRTAAEGRQRDSGPSR